MDEVIELTAMQHDQMAKLVRQLDTTRVVAENFVSYFAKELGVNLQLYQFDTDRLAFVPSDSFAPPPAASEALTAIHSNGQHELEL